MTQKIDISVRTLFIIAVSLLCFWLLLKISDIILLVFVAFIVMAAINPLVDRLEKLRLSRALSILIIYIITWGIFGSLIAVIIPPLVDQTTKLIRLLPDAVMKIEFFTSHQQIITDQIISRVGVLPESLLRISLDIFSNIVNILTTLVISFYLLLYHPRLEKSLNNLLGKSTNNKIPFVITQVEKRLGYWVRGELFLMLSIGTITYVFLLLIGVENALPLAILAGFLELIPNIGPTLAAIPAVLISLTISPLLALTTLAIYIIIQTFENHVLVPKVMQKAVGINPLVSILGLMVGFRLAGPTGAILAIPLLISLEIIIPNLEIINLLENIFYKKSLEESKPDSV